MARLLAVGWDEREARFVLGDIHRGKLKIIDTGSAPINLIFHEDDEPTPDVAGTLRQALAERRIGRCRALVALSRSTVEVMHFELPPATDYELPELVKNQAIRDSSTVEENTPVDFITTDEGLATEKRTVTVVALPDARLRAIRETCSKAGLRPLRMPMRSLAAASLFKRSLHRTDETCLLVNLVSDQLDLTILSRGRSVFSRSVRLPDEVDDDGLNARIVAEVNRTLAVAPQEATSGGAVERIFLLAGPEEHALLADRLTAELSLEVTLVDPFASIEAPPDVVPRESGRFAPLVGTLLDEADGGEHPIDILHPKRKPKPRNYALPVLAAAAAVALVAVGYVWMKHQDLADLQAEIETRKSRHAELMQAYQTDQYRRTRNAYVHAWENRGVNWLDELRDLSLRLPGHTQFVGTSVTLTSGGGPSGQITLSGRLDQYGTIQSLERSFRDPYHRMQTQQLLPVADSNYSYQFTAVIACSRPPNAWNVYYNRLPNPLKVLSFPPRTQSVASPQAAQVPVASAAGAGRPTPASPVPTATATPGPGASPTTPAPSPSPSDRPAAAAAPTPDAAQGGPEQ